MLGSRGTATEATRVCPHCKATVLARFSVCPGCGHHLKFNNQEPSESTGYQALQVEGTIKHRNANEGSEYCVVLTIENDRGQRVVRQVVNVGTLQPAESRSVRVAIEMFPAAK